MKKDKIVQILNALKGIATNTGIWLKVIILVVTGFGGAILFSKTKVKKEDCTAWQKQVQEVTEQNRQLIGAFIDIKKELAVVKPTAYYWQPETGFEFSGFRDTLPPTQRQKEKAAVQKVMSKIDSILWKWKQDSINKQKSKT